MSQKTIGLIMIIAGAFLFILSLVADYIRLGSYPGINVAQITGAVVGVVVLLIGVWLNRRKDQKEE